MGLAVGRKREAQRLLGAGLADRAGDADDLRLRARARRAREVAQRRRARRRTTRSGAVPGSAARACRRRPTASAGAGRERRGHEVVAVAVVALDARRTPRPAATRAGVDRDAGDGCRQRARPRSARIACAIASTVQSALMPRPPPASAAATASWSLNGKHLFADDLAGFMALAGDQQHVAAAQLGDRGADRLAAVADLDRAGRSLRGWRRGSRPAVSLRGLSSVTIDAVGLLRPRSAPSSGACPDRDRRRSRTPRRGGRSRRAAARRAPWRARRACGRNRRRSARRSFSPTSSSRPLAPLSCASAAKAAAGSPPVAIARPAATSAFSTWKSPDQRQPHRVVVAGVHDVQRLRKAVDRRSRRDGCPRRCGRR